MQQIPRFLAFLAIILTTACGGGDDPASGTGTGSGAAEGAEDQPLLSSSADTGQGVRASDPTEPEYAGALAPGSGISEDGGVDLPASGGIASPGDSRQTNSAAPPIAGRTAGAHEVLLRAERAYAQVRSMQADFAQQVFVPLLESTQNSRGTIYHRSPDRFLMRFSDPAGDVIVADGRYVWMFYPSTDDGQVMRAPLAAAGQQADLYREFLSDATSRYSAALNGPQPAGGRPAQALTLIPRGASPYSRVRIWVDDQDSLVRRFEITEENGTVRNIEMSGLRSNLNLADNLFQFTPPAGVQVHDF